MKIEALHIGQNVRHPQYGLGVVKSISETTAEILFNDGKRTVAPEAAGLQAAEPQISASGLEMPLKQFVEQTVAAAIEKLGLEKPDAVVEKLGLRWHAGKMVLHPSDASLQSKEVPLETFFHKIVMVRNNLRVLEQKINAHEKLSDGEKVEMQQYISRSYGSLTTFNILFKEKEDQF
jgi:superoxide dismutase